METIKNAPGTRSEYAGDHGQFQGKDTVFSLGYHQQRVYNLLCRGGRHSAADISVALRLSDPRSTIRVLRHKGIPIIDEWVKAVHGGRYKRYFIRKEARDDQQ